MNNPPRVILKWPNGLDRKPEIYPVTDTSEEAEQVMALLDKLFSGMANAG